MSRIQQTVHLFHPGLNILEGGSITHRKANETPIATAEDAVTFGKRRMISACRVHDLQLHGKA
jgi:hypothetical protein